MAEMTWKSFEEDYERLFERVWQACFLLTGSVKAAEDHCFRAFLVLGAAKNAENVIESRTAEELLGHAVGELARRYYGKQPRRRLTRRFLMKHPLPVAVTDGMLSFMHLPLNTRIVSVLYDWGVAADRLYEAAGLRVLRPKAVPLPDMTDTLPPSALKPQMKDRIYMRFSERSVAV